MKKLHMALMGVIAAGCVGESLAQSNITLIAEADTCIQENKPTTSSADSRLSLRSRDVSGSGRQNLAYIRFNLGVLASAPEANATFLVSRDGIKLTTFSSIEVEVYGLLDTAGNTSQQWNENMTYNSSGLETPGDGDATTQDLDPARVVFIGNFPLSSSPYAGEEFSISNAALDTFIADRYAADGNATLMLVEKDGADRELYFTHRETTSTNTPPSLIVNGELGGGVEDTTPPTVSLVSPTNGAIDISVTDNVLAQFSEPMDASTIHSNSFMLYDVASNLVAASISYDSGTLTASLDPQSWLAGNSTYTAVVMAGVTDVATNALAADHTWTFTTGESTVINPDQPYTLEPRADTYLTNDQDSGPTETHGDKPLVEVRWHEIRVHIGYVGFDITGVDSSMFDGTTLSGSFFSTGFNSPGTWNVYGVDDDQDNNWNESSVNYATAPGLDPTAAINSFGITNATLLGTITLDGSDPTNTAPTFVSSSTNLNLTPFLEADTDGKITLIIMTETQTGSEYRVDAKEGLSTAGHGPMTLNFPARVSPATATTIHTLMATGTSISFSWDALDSHSYTVERNQNLSPSAGWIPMLSSTITNSYSDTEVNDNAFYRVVDEGILP